MKKVEIAMGKTVTVRLDEKAYRMIKSAALAKRRTISNFMENATLSHILKENFVSDEEMTEILSNKPLLKRLKQSAAEAKKGNYRIVK